MTRGSARFLHVSTALVGGSGLVYAWMRYLVEPADEFAVVNHPWQPDALHAHIAVAPLLVFACGWIWLDHVWRRVRSGFAGRRRSGLALFALFGPMVLSGYLLQISEAELAREIWIVTHVATSLLWTSAYLVHQLAPRPAR